MPDAIPGKINLRSELRLIQNTEIKQNNYGKSMKTIVSPSHSVFSTFYLLRPSMVLTLLNLNKSLQMLQCLHCLLPCAADSPLV